MVKKSYSNTKSLEEDMEIESMRRHKSGPHEDKPEHHVVELIVGNR